MATQVLNLREFANQIRTDGPVHNGKWAAEIHRIMDENETVDAIAYELGEPEDLANECRRLKTLEQRLLQKLVDWGAVDKNDANPPDPVNILTMLLG